MAIRRSRSMFVPIPFALRQRALRGIREFSAPVGAASLRRRPGLPHRLGAIQPEVHSLATLAPPMRRFGVRDFALMGVAITLLTATLTALSFGMAPSTRSEAMSLALIIHLGTVLPALPLGAYILLSRKGGRVHRLLGRTWAGMMMVTAISSFWLTSNGGLSPIHIFSVMTLVSIPMAVVAIRRGHVERHRRAIMGVYIGLVIAGAFAFLPGRLLNTWLVS
jgi:uncharacterized membrane protein